MKIINLLINTLLISTLFGCAGAGDSNITQNYSYKKGDSFSFEIIDQANVSEEGMKIFKNRLAEKSNELGLVGDSTNKIVEITFTEYKMRHGASRALLGAFAGSDSISTKMIIKGKNDGNIIGQLQVESGNVSAVGSAKQLIEQHANKIANYLKTGELSIF